MPWGWECRSKLIKQVPMKPTKKRQPIAAERITPGPDHYETQQIIGGKGYSKIKRAPAYSVGEIFPADFSKPVISPSAPTLDIAGLSNMGKLKVTHGLMLPNTQELEDRTQKPGPNAYTPSLPYKKAPAYTCRPAARPPYEPSDMWKPTPNMYWPPIPGKKNPAYTLGYPERKIEPPKYPGPGEHDPKYDFVKRAKPSFSFGPPFRTLKPMKSPAPNTYCEKKFMVPKRTIPAISFGIRHSKSRGEHAPHLKPSKQDLVVKLVP